MLHLLLSLLLFCLLLLSLCLLLFLKLLHDFVFGEFKFNRSRFFSRRSDAHVDELLAESAERVRPCFAHCGSFGLTSGINHDLISLLSHNR